MWLIIIRHSGFLEVRLSDKAQGCPEWYVIRTRWFRGILKVKWMFGIRGWDKQGCELPLSTLSIPILNRPCSRPILLEVLANRTLVARRGTSLVTISARLLLIHTALEDMNTDGALEELGE